MRSTFHDAGDDEEGAVLGHRRKKIDSGDLDITPMIDVTFLLLIFFMVTSTMKEPATADVPPARHGVGADSTDAMIISISSEGDEITKIQLPDGTETTLDDLRKSKALTTQVQAGANEVPPKTSVIVNADRDLPHGTVREVSQMIGEVEGIRLFLGVQDK